MATAFLDQLLDDFATWLQDVDSCRALILFGSTARGEGDQYSDHDIQVVATDRDDEQYIEWMRDYAPLWTLAGDHGNTPLWVIMYRGGHKVHLSVIHVDDLQKVIDSGELDSDYRRGYKILIDKDNQAAQLATLPPYPSASLPTQDEFTERIESLFYGLCLTAKYLKRGDLYTVQINGGIFLRFLLPLIEWHTRANNPDVDTWHRGEHMQEWVNPAIWQGLHSTAGHFDADDGWRALFAMAEFVETLTQETAKLYDYTYPQTTFAEVKAYLRQLQETPD